MMNKPNNLSARLPYKARLVASSDGLTLVLLDPDIYLADPHYVARRKAGESALRNLWAFDRDGNKLWEAELPESNDYYHEFKATPQLTAMSFSGYSCELDTRDGSIISRVFHK
jgi:hypothetical protein